jgi:hypothetical protein
VLGEISPNLVALVALNISYVARVRPKAKMPEEVVNCRDMSFSQD